ncbi:MAG: Prolipoprotein diacylglyceryl transferase [Candidatus Hydrogenedentes bacterium ADurb.Bin101]|nr:MAG: Prolipoprotein diacylglyceryl transferase [Candidatus Hydrogenedentes bacterium ADurb.Bin101]
MRIKREQEDEGVKRILFTMWGLPVPAYTFFLCFSFVFCIFGMVWYDRRSATPLRVRPDIGVWAFLGAVLGARLFYLVQFNQPLCQVFQLTGSGLVFYGGFAGGLVAVLLYARIFAVPILPLLDLAAPFVALGEAITRIGCLCNGCCWGAPTRLPWGIHFPRYSFAWRQHVNEGRIWADASHSLPVHPTQLYMTLGLLILFVALLLLLRQKGMWGGPLCGYLIGYGVLRGIVEMFRGDSAHDLLGMTVSQVISIGLVIFGVTLLILRQYACSTPVCNDTTAE